MIIYRIIYLVAQHADTLQLAFISELLFKAFLFPSISKRF